MLAMEKDPAGPEAAQRRTKTAQAPEHDTSKLAQPAADEVLAPELLGALADVSDRAPWHVRHARWVGLGAGAGLLAILSALALYAWNALHPSELDQLRLTVPALPLQYEAAERPIAAPPVPAAGPRQPAAPPKRTEPPRADPVAKSSPPSPGGARAGVTHTRRQDAGALSGATPRRTARAPAS